MFHITVNFNTKNYHRIKKAYFVIFKIIAKKDLYKKLADSTDSLIYYSAAIYHASALFKLDDLIWSCFKQNQNLDYECKVWFIITIAYWLSSSIRNVQNLGQHLRGYDVDYTITPLIYLTFISYAYFSGNVQPFFRKVKSVQDDFFPGIIFWEFFR